MNRLKADTDGVLAVEIVAGAGSGGTASADDADFTAGSTSGTPAMGVYESSPTSVTDGDLGVVGITQTRELKVSIEADNVGIGGGTQYTEDAVAAADPVGNAQILVREDSPVSIAADGDNVALRGTAYGAAYAQIVDSSGNFVDTFGGGTQYTEGDTDTTITGTAMLMEGATNTLLPVQGTVADGLLVNLGSNNDITGTVTANAGTNLNTSALALESGGNLDSIATLLGTIDADTSTLAGTDFMLGTDFSAVFGVNTLLTTTQADARANTVDTFTVNSWGQYFNGTTWDRMRGDATNGMLVNLGSNNDVTVTGTVDLGSTDNAVLDTIASPVATVSSTPLQRVAIFDDSDTQITSFGGGTQYAVDAALGSTPTGTLSLAIRDDALSSLTPVEGDAVGLRTDANGALWVIPSGTVTVDGSGVTQPVSGTVTANLGSTDNAVLDTIASPVSTISSTPLQRVAIFDASDTQITSFGGGTQYTEDAAAPSNPVGTAMMMERDDALAGLTPVEGDWTHPFANANGALWVAVDDSTAVDVNLASLDGALLTATHGDSRANTTDGLNAAAFGYMFNGTTWDRVRGDTTNGLTVKDGNLATVFGSSNVIASGRIQTIDGNSASSLTALQLIDDTIFADDAAFTLASSKVSMAGAIRDDSLSTLTAVEGDAVPLRVSSTGALHVTGGGGGTEYTEDVATANPIVGTATMMERDDALSTVTPIEGDWIGLRGTAEGALWTQDFNSDAILTAAEAVQAAVEGTLTVAAHAVTNAGTFAVQEDGAALTALQLIDDAVYVDDADWTDSTSKHLLVGGLYQSTEQTVTDGDVAPFQIDSNGRLKVSIEVDNVGIGGGTQYTEDAAAAANPVGNALILVREDARAGSLTTADGDNVAARGNNKGELYTIDTDAVALLTTIDADTGAILADTANMDTNLGTVAGAVSGGQMQVDIVADGAGLLTTSAFNTVLGSASLVLATQADDVANTSDGLQTTAFGYAFDGTTWDRMRGDSSNGLLVNLGSNNDVTVSGSLTSAGNVTNAGTFAVQVNGSALTALQLIDNSIVAHDAAASGSTGVNMAGGVATNNIEGRTQVANNDASRIVTDLNGVQVTRPHTTLEEILSERVTNTDGASTAFSTFGAGGAGIHNYITTITIYNSSATDGYVDFRDGTAGSVLFTAPAPTVGGSVINLPVPLKTSANTALAYDVSGALSTVYISVVGFQAQG